MTAPSTIQQSTATADHDILEIRPPQVFLSRAEVAALEPEQVRQRVIDLQPLIAKNASLTEESRRPVPEVWDALADAGIFYHFVPKRFGGCEFGLEAFVDAMLPIGEVCASTCWTATFIVEHNWIAALFPEAAQEEFFADGRYVSAPAVSNPMGLAQPTAGGYRLSGHYRFGSGVMNGDWVFGLAVVEGSEPPNPAWFAVPADEVTVLDTWKVDGMAGTGSNDIVIEDAFVPEHRVLNWDKAMRCMAPGARIHANSIYRMLPVQFLSLCTTIPAVGAANGLVKYHRERMVAGRLRYGSTTPQADKSAAQVRVAKADLLAHSAELALRDVARRIDAAAHSSTPASERERVGLIAQCAHASGLAQQAATTVLQGAGASIHVLSNPMQRLVRDINVTASHQLHEFDEVAEQYGRTLFDLEPNSVMR
jgi:alkylation response protein AidB-like acyl-CoA dehydrogenase